MESSGEDHYLEKSGECIESGASQTLSSEQDGVWNGASALHRLNGGVERLVELVPGGVLVRELVAGARRVEHRGGTGLELPLDVVVLVGGAVVERAAGFVHFGCRL